MVALMAEEGQDGLMMDLEKGVGQGLEVAGGTLLPRHP